jgi:chromosome segregation ATPase
MAGGEDEHIGEPRPTAKKLERCNEHQPLSDCVADLVYEFRRLEDGCKDIRTELRDHDDNVLKFWKELAQLDGELKVNAKTMEKVVGMLKSTNSRLSNVTGHLDELLALVAKNMSTSKTNEDWFKKQFEDFLKAQRSQEEANRKANAKMIWKLVGVIVTLALFIAGITGNINLPW